MQIPTLKGEVAPERLPTFRVQPVVSTANESIAQAGQAVSRTIYAVQQEEQRKADRAAFMEADRQTDTVANDLYSQAQQVQLKDAIGLSPKLLSEFDKQTGEVEASLKTDRQRLAYREAINQRRSQLERSLNSHENAERERYYEKSREDYKAQAHVNAVTNYRDAGAVEQEIDKIRATVDQTPGLDADQKRSELEIRRSGVYAGVIERYLANDQVKDADAYYKGIKGRVNGPVAADIERAILSAKQRMEAENKAKLTELRQSLGDQLRDIQAAAYAGVPVDRVPPKSVLEAAFGKYEGAQRFESAQRMANLSVEVGALHTLSASELIDKAQSYKPQQVEGAAEASQTAAFIAGQAGRIFQERKKDPAGYLVTHSPTVSKAWEAFQENDDDVSRGTYLKAVRAERERLGIPGNDILPDAYVEGIATQIGTSDAQKLADTIEREAQKWGQDWPAVQGQLAGKISDTAAVISSGIARGAAVQLAATSKLKENELKALLPPGATWGDVQAQVRQTFEPFAASLPPEAAKTLNAFQDSATRLTVQYMHQGMNQSNAAEKAYKDLIRDQIVEFRSSPFRVPPTEDAEKIEDGAKRVISKFVAPPGSVIADGAFTEEEYAGQLTEHVRNNGYFVTRPDAKGLRLYVDGGPVAGMDGPVQYTWEELRTTGDEAVLSSEAKDRKALEWRKESR